MLSFHVQVERNWSCACSLNYKQIPPSSTKAILYIYVCVCAYVCTYINLVVRESSPWNAAAKLVFKGPTWLTWALCLQDAQVSCAEHSVPPAQGVSRKEFSSLDEVTPWTLNKHKAESTHQSMSTTRQVLTHSHVSVWRESSVRETGKNVHRMTAKSNQKK